MRKGGGGDARPRESWIEGWRRIGKRVKGDLYDLYFFVQTVSQGELFLGMIASTPRKNLSDDSGSQMLQNKAGYRFNFRRETVKTVIVRTQLIKYAWTSN